MFFEYDPSGKIIINGITSIFGENRDIIRSRIGLTFREDNQVIPIGDGEHISQRRDIYTGFDSKEGMFFLIYNDEDLLSEVEVHRCESIKVLDVTFSFDNETDEIANALGAFSPVIQQNDGEFFARNLKIVLMSEAQMGGEGNALGYFYCAADISHIDAETP